jgi:hypothetical protein
MAMAPMCVCAGMDAFSTAKILTNRGEELEKVLRKLAPKVRFLLGKTCEDHGNITVIYIYIIIIVIIIIIIIWICGVFMPKLYISKRTDKLGCETKIYKDMSISSMHVMDI